jgi:hypothetical protein
MRAQARAASGETATTLDAAPWIDLQRWLAAQVPQQVVVPFGNELAELVPATAVRMRRDFPQLLSCIKVVALLHQRQRDITADGAIVATLDDYAEARALLAPVFDSITADGATPAIRATVEAVPGGGQEISATALAARLQVEKSTISWRMGRALKKGWVKNLETRKGHPHRLVRGEPMPDEATALPPVERVREVFDRSSRGVRMTPFAVTDTPNRSCAEVFECSNGNRERPGDTDDDHEFAAALLSEKFEL